MTNGHAHGQAHARPNDLAGAHDIVENTSGFQIIFIFTQYAGTPGLAGNLTMTGSNSFLLDGGKPQQVLPYGTNATPALTNLSLSKQAFQFSGLADPAASSQSLELVTMVTAVGDTLDVTVANVDAQAQVRYQFVGYSNSGVLSLGPNSISFP